MIDYETLMDLLNIKIPGELKEAYRGGEEKQARGMGDEDIIQKGLIENWILMTNDKDFGEKVYREKRPHKGIILLRLEDERAFVKIEIIKRLLEGYADRLSCQFVVVTESGVRFAGAL